MKAELKSIRSPDLLGEVATFHPEDPENFSLLLQLMIGVPGTTGEELFYVDLILCTPEWIKAELAEGGSMWGIDLLVVPHFEYKSLELVLKSKVNGVKGRSVIEITEKIDRLGRVNSLNDQ